jgi:hypothetical protein
MKKLIFSVVLMSLVSLTGCLSTRIQLFTVSLESGTFSMSRDEDIVFLEHQITTFDLVFTETDEVTDRTEGYVQNKFGDFSSKVIKVYIVELTIGVDGINQVYDVQFEGIANPQRQSAYHILVSIPDLSLNPIRIVLDLADSKNDNGLVSIHIQMIDDVNHHPNQQDANFVIHIQGA